MYEYVLQQYKVLIALLSLAGRPGGLLTVVTLECYY